VEPESDPGLAERRVMTEPGGRASPRAARIATGAASRGGVEGDGWDDEFQFTPRADASPRSSGKRTPPRSPRGGAPAGGSTRILFYPTSPRPRGDDAHSPASSSGTSRGSPDENQDVSQIPGSSGRRRGFTDGFTPPSADPNASPPAPNRVSVSPFEQRRRQALLEKQRRFAEMIGRIRAPDSPEQPPPPPRADPVATATTTPRRRTRILPRDEDETDPAPAAAAVDVSTDSDAWTPVSHSRDHRQSGESPVVDSWDEIEAPAVTPPGARRRRPPGDNPSSPSSSHMRTPADEPLELSPDDVTSGGTGRRLSEDELVARYRVFARDDDDDDDDGGARRAAEPNPPSWPFSRNPSGGSDVQAAAFSPRELAEMAPGRRAESPAKSRCPSPSIELPGDDSSSGGFATPQGATPTSGGGGRIEITTEDDDGDDGDGAGERVESRNTPEHAPSSPTTANAEAIAGRSRVPLTSRAAKFMAKLGAARRGTAEDRADIRRRLGLPEVDEGARRSFAEEEEDRWEEEREEAGPYATRSPDRKPRSLAGSWLSDSAAAAAAAAPRLGPSPRSPRMPSIREEPPSSPGLPQSLPQSSPGSPAAGDVAYSPANSTPTPPRTPMRRFQAGSANGETPTRRYPGPVANPPRSPAGSNDADKAAAARKLLAAASPSKRQTLGGSGLTAVTSVTSPVPSPGGHDPGKAAAARRIMLAAAAKKAAAGADDGSGSFDHGDDEEFGLDLVFSPASGAKATAVTASGGGGGGTAGGGGGTAGGAIAERAVSAQRQLGFAQPGAASDSGNESVAGVYDSAFEFRSPRRHEAEVRARMVRLNEVPPPPSVAPAAHHRAEVSRFGGDAADKSLQVTTSHYDEDAATATDYETDAGYGTAMDSLPSGGTSGDTSNPRALRVALEKLEMRLEEAGWEKEALETRLAEAEATLARTDAVNGARISQLSAEVQQNDYLRRLLKRAEEMRNAARMQAKEARVRLEIRERELESRRIEIDRMEAERDGLRRRILTEKRRSDAMERTIEAQNDELEESHGRRVTMTQLAGLLVCFLVILWMRIRFGPREIPAVEPPPPSNIRTIEFGRRVGTHTPLRKPDP